MCVSVSSSLSLSLSVCRPFILSQLSYKMKAISAMSECREDLLARSHPGTVNSTPLPSYTELKCFSMYSNGLGEDAGLYTEHSDTVKTLQLS